MNRLSSGLMNRLSSDAMLMQTARLAAARGTCNRAQVGAVIARDTRVITTGRVGSLPGQPHCIDVGCKIGPEGGCVRTQHAEANAIGFAAKHGIALAGAELFVTLAPCLPCAKLIASAGIVVVKYDVEYRKTDGIEFLVEAGIRVEHFHE